VTGKYHTVTCLDVMIHYPQDKADAMISHLAGLAEERLIISFAPKTPYYSLLKRIGELFPGPSKVGDIHPRVGVFVCGGRGDVLFVTDGPRTRRQARTVSAALVHLPFCEVILCCIYFMLLGVD